VIDAPPLGGAAQIIPVGEELAGSMRPGPPHRQALGELGGLNAARPRRSSIGRI
jgi:hypothetical protein